MDGCNHLSGAKHKNSGRKKKDYGVLTNIETENAS